MIKRLTAWVLVLALAFSLSACGKGTAGSTGKYASDQPMDVFAAIEAVKALKDFDFELRVSKVNPETGEPDRTKYTLSGSWFTSTKQASAALRLEDGTLLTTLTVDGANLYADVGTAASVLEPRLRELGAQANADEMEGVNKRLTEKMVHIPLQEDPWTSLESGRLSGSREGLKKLYQKVKQNNARRVRLEEHVGVLSLGLGDLQGTLLDITGDLMRNKSLYQGELAQVLSQDFGLILDQQGLDAETQLGEKWAVYEETGAELAELQESGDINGWTAKLLACGDEKNGYSLDLTLNFNSSANYCLSVYPAKAKAVELPKSSVEVQDAAEAAMLAYVNGKEYLNSYTESAGEAEDAQELTEEEVQEYFGLEDESGDELMQKVDTVPLTGSDTLITTTVSTSDGIQRTVPLLAQYDSLQGDGGGIGATDVFESSSGYVLEYVNAEERDLLQAVEDNARMYATEFKEGWGFDIVTEPSKAVLSAAGDVAAAGMAYHDVDLDQDITVITCCLKVEKSSDMICLDLFVYSKSVTDKEMKAIEDLMRELGVTLPVEIIKN